MLTFNNHNVYRNIYTKLTLIRVEKLNGLSLFKPKKQNKK